MSRHSRTDVTEPMPSCRALAGTLPSSPRQTRIRRAFESSANAVGNFANVFVYDLGLDYYSRYAAQVNAVTVDQTAGVAKKYLDTEKMVVIAVGDRSKIEMPLRELGLGPVEIWDADGKRVN